MKLRKLSMINIVIPMAGAGSRFINAGYKDPKPLISILGHSMIEWVVKNLTPSLEHRYIFICQKEHIHKYNLMQILRELSPSSLVLSIESLTSGAACTTLAAKEYINNNTPLLIANCDQFINVDINDYLKALFEDGIDGAIMTMKASDPKWSYVSFDKDGYINFVVEKEVISNDATVGIYGFRRGSDFVLAAEEMISLNIRVNNEFYVAPTYNQLIKRNAKITPYNIGDVENSIFGLGTPEDLKLFLRTDICFKAAEDLF